MGSDIAQNAGEGADLDWVMVWNRDMVLAALGRDHADVTASLSYLFVPDETQCFGQFGSRQISFKSHIARDAKLRQADRSTGQHFVPHKM